MRRKNNLKLPNGFGSIIHLGGNRRKPYGALKTVGWNENGNAIREYVGYADTWNNAYKLLLNYNDKPYDLKNKNITIDDIYNIIEPIMKEDYLNEVDGMSKSNYKNLVSAYNNHLNKLKDVNILEIKKNQIQTIINQSGLKHTGRGYIKNIFDRIISYAIDELELPIDHNLTNLNIGTKEKSTKHIPFKDEEIQLIKELAENNDIAKLIMIYFYTGLRPSELLNIEVTNVFLNENYMIGGSKTKAGKNRTIPIHSKIKDYIKYFYNQNKKYLISSNGTNKKIAYDYYQKSFNKLMNQLGLNHSPYDTRHTFGTKCSECGISESNIKRLMGHSLSNDVTNDVYIHKAVEELIKEVEKIIY